MFMPTNNDAIAASKDILFMFFLPLFWFESRLLILWLACHLASNHFGRSNAHEAIIFVAATQFKLIKNLAETTNR
jgi:hypothetical protein